MDCQLHFFFVMLLISRYLSACLIYLCFSFPRPMNILVFTYLYKSERLCTTYKRELSKFTIECFIIVPQGLSREVHLVTGCLAMPMLLRPVRKTAKSFKWNRQVQKSPPYPTLCFHNKDGVQYTNPKPPQL